MKKLFQRRALQKALKTAMLAAFVGAFCRAAVAEDISDSVVVPGGGTVSFTGAASMDWVHNAATGSDELVLVFTNSASTTSSFTLPGTTAARILAVGGGGGGGGSYSLATAGRPNGGGAGGGAGGLVETNDLFGAGTYSVTVGAGGAGGAINNRHAYTTPPSVDYAGEDGGTTTILLDGAPFITVLGGGAGGGESGGHDGASGGGGSIYRSSAADTTGTPHAGGAGVDGQGYAGGAGDANNYGGGGGGAGGAGAAASATSGGVGGIGVENDITGTPVWYAGGGGGGCNSTAAAASTAHPDGIAGGQGGGGKGGVGNKNKNINPTPGEDGTGGGGGGASYNMPGGKGGDGIVIVRIAAALDGPLDRPEDVVYEYDGNPHTSYATTVFYTVTGDNVATDVGVYTAVVTPATGIMWTDGTQDPVTVRMTIVAAGAVSGTVDVTGAPVSFYGAAETNWIGGDLLIKFTGAGGFTLPGTTKARMLAVGGGGGGGGTYSLATAGRPNGGGGGGGAGGLVATNDLFGAGAYVVSVGGGGSGAVVNNRHPYATPQSVDYAGEDGKPTTVLLDGASFITALGGGAGGGESDGHDGGSGGGGSIYRSSATDTTGTPHAGGAGTVGQGHAGGAGDANNYGGGGGGAGGAGAAASATGGGVGGIGVENDITGTAVWYAGGGGGGCNSTAADAATAHPDGIAGGQGGGGTGGVGNKNKNINPTPGEDGTGGGGGGASYNMPGAKGGDGVFYIRISMTMNGSLEKPTDPAPITYDGNAHTSIVSTAFFDVTGDNVGTNAGSYTAVATLKPGCTWLDGSSGDAAVTMTINPVEFTIVSLTQPGWTYNDSPTPDPACSIAAADASVIRLVYEYADSEDAEEWSADKPVDAGSYYVRVRAADAVNYRATPSSLKTPFTISRVSVTFADLRIRDWLYGTPEASTPNPKCTVSPEWVLPIYEYADSADATEWLPEKPVAAGTHYVRVRAPNTLNYEYTPLVASFKIVKGLGNIFTDYVEITVAGWTGSSPAELTNFPYKVTLTERDPEAGAYAADSLVGFFYERAGISGDDFAFTDEDGNVLCFYMKKWEPGGDSVVYVKIPKIGAETQKIRFYWHVREGQGAPEHSPSEIWSDWSEEERDAVAQPGHTFGLVYKDGTLVNYWTQLPSMDKTSWNAGDTPGVVNTPAVLAEGAVLQTVKDAGGAVLPGIPAAAPGVYRISFTPNDPDGEYEPIARHIDFSIYGSVPTDDLTGGLTGEMALTLNGRVLLANDDAADGHAVIGQAYWRTREVNIGGGKILTNDVFWTHTGEHLVFDRVKLFETTVQHTLNVVGADGATNVIWRMNDVGIGNGFRPSTSGLRTDQCALPWSATGLGSSSYENRNEAGAKMEAGNIVMRNVEDAAVYSPCYTNGIGTIYFDAVNNHIIEEDVAPDVFRLVVEISTETEDGNIPTDGNAVRGSEVDLDRTCRWVPYEMLPLKRDGTASFVSQQKTNDLALAISVAQTDSNFYRVCVPVNYHGPVRFRIRRASKNDDWGADNDGLILLDNIIVSYPACEATMKPYGKYDQDRGGKQTLGQEAAMENVPFPSVGDVGNLIGRGILETYASVFADANPATFVQSAAMHYRWRYLNQSFVPESGWRSVPLSPFDGYRASEPLDVPAEPGDIEFWYELKTMMPYYSYYDYSGTGARLGGFYTEEVTAVTNRMDLTGLAGDYLPSGGKDWFVRLREGASEWEDVSVVCTGAYKANQKMELVSDHTWRGLVKVPQTNSTGSVTFYFQAGSRQVAGAETFVENETQYFPTADVTELPSRGEVSTSGAPKTYEADGASGYIEFIFNDASLTFSIGHAEYQNFNAWHDANREGEIFVGTYNDKSGVTTATMLQTNANMRAWPLLATENSNWNESFEMANYLDAGYPKGVVLKSHKMPHQWDGANGMFVDARLTTSNLTQRMQNSGIAWQMQGEGLGEVAYTQSDGPSGLDQISFKARLAQSVSFNDFSIWYGNDSFATNNYTLVVPALMSYAQKDSSTYDYAPGASMSVVAYYQPMVGCYEFRIERNSSDGLQFSIYKWSLKNMKVSCELLTTHWFSGAAFWNNEGATKPKLFAMLVSVGEDDGKTTIIAGLTTAQNTPNSTYSNVAYNMVCYQDGSTTRLKAGTYGVLPANCNGRFLHPRQYSSRLARSTIAGGATADLKDFYAAKSVTLVGSYDQTACRSRLSEAWAYAPGRTEMYEDESNGYGLTPRARGVRAPAGLSQTVDVYLKSREKSNAAWSDEPVGQLTFSGYSFTEKTLTVRTNESCHVRLKTGDLPVDVTVWDIKQTGWNGEDIANIGNLANGFVYTQARVIEEVDSSMKTNRYTMLQPARADAGKALSIRSPVLNGLGMVGFSYKNVKPGCEVWLQAATNDVLNSLDGTFGYNFATNSVELGTPEPHRSWITLRKYTYDELVGASAKSYSCGWHTNPDRPLEGAFRVVVAPSVVVASQSRAKTDPEWGSITITDIFVHDEPAIDKTSWLGWNIRTMGDAADTERRMFLPDSFVKADGETGIGLSAGLNNSMTANTDPAKDISEYNQGNPSIQSPTFGAYSTAGGTAQATIGQVRFRARLYETNKASTAVGTVSLYGVMNGQSDDWGEALTNITVDSFVYRTFEYSASSKKRFAAIRIVVDGVTNNVPGVQRVLLDEVSVSERTKASVGFAYARPFRTGLSVDKEITNILDKDQQPLTDESWGVQAKLKFDKYDAEIDASRGFRVYFRYFRGRTPWGYDNWENEPGASQWAELVQVGEEGDYVFRSTAANTSTVVPSQSEANSVVQYMLRVEYYLKGVAEAQPADIVWSTVEGDGWTNPAWYEPVDYNTDPLYGNGDHFSPYTILDSVSPGRVWINEVNYCDGPRDLTGNVKCVTNQFIELAVPWGVDLKGWKVVLTDMDTGKSQHSVTLAELGKNGVPSSKKTGNHSGDYDFLVLQSPATRDAGGIKDPETGEVAADGTWVSSGPGMNSTFQNGSLQYDQPYQLELFRPSGVLEHQFVVAGTNEWRTPPEYFDSFGFRYDGTNLVNELNALDSSARRFFAGEDLARKPDGVTWSSIGVAGGAHGEEGGWSSAMKFTPGRVNEGQDELSDWYLKPYGASIWVYARSTSPHVVQTIGEDTAQDTFFLVNSGASTNISYSVAPWHSIGALTVNGETNAHGVTGSYVLSLNNITQTTFVVASDGIDPQLLAAGLDPADRYTPAVVNWLLARAEAGELANPNGPISLGHHKGLQDDAPAYEMPLKVMYWFDLDPTEPGWWLRHGFLNAPDEGIRRKRVWNKGTAYEYVEHMTNRMAQVRMYLTNDVSGVVYAPYRLQGLANEQSDLFTGNWTSETFKINVMLNNGLPNNAGFLPFRCFTLSPGSFSPAPDYEAKIEILDPFASTSSAGYDYGWYGQSNYSLLFRFSFDESLGTGIPVETLKADSTYDGIIEDDD